MSDAALWWHELPNRFLVDVLSAINYSRCRNETVDRCQHLSGALNQMWNAFYEYRKGRGRLNQKELENEKEGRVADNQSIQELILHGITDEQGSAVCGTDCVRRFCEFTPQIMNQRTLKNGNFDASNISDELRRRATKEHRDLLGAFRKWETTPSVANKTWLLKKLAFLIYVVRCNIAHSEKTPRGPDLAKRERDRHVSGVAAALIEELFDSLFDRPSNRLAVYGTQAPNEVNASQLADLAGNWQTGEVCGVIGDNRGLPEFYWNVEAPPVSVRMFSALGLNARFQERLDGLAAPLYRRVLVPVVVHGSVWVCNIYEGTQ